MKSKKLKTSPVPYHGSWWNNKTQESFYPHHKNETLPHADYQIRGNFGPGWRYVIAL